eukprot:231921-Chlamydomonas_euryale.AAC.1
MPRLTKTRCAAAETAASTHAFAVPVPSICNRHSYLSTPSSSRILEEHHLEAQFRSARPTSGTPSCFVSHPQHLLHAPVRTPTAFWTLWFTPPPPSGRFGSHPHTTWTLWFTRSTPNPDRRMRYSDAVQVRNTKLEYDTIACRMTEELNRFQKERSHLMSGLMRRFALTQVRAWAAPGDAGAGGVAGRRFGMPEDSCDAVRSRRYALEQLHA